MAGCGGLSGSEVARARPRRQTPECRKAVLVLRKNASVNSVHPRPVPRSGRSLCFGRSTVNLPEFKIPRWPSYPTVIKSSGALFGPRRARSSGRLKAIARDRDVLPVRNTRARLMPRMRGFKS
jgi:hypothetical protein